MLSRSSGVFFGRLVGGGFCRDSGVGKGVACGVFGRVWFRFVFFIVFALVGI